MKKAPALFVIVVLLLAGCASSHDIGKLRTEAEQNTTFTGNASGYPQSHKLENSAPVSTAPGNNLSDYRIGAGDVLEITVFGEETLSRSGLVVKPDGKISFPLVGDVQAGGRTSAEVKEQLETNLREYIPAAVASVSVVQLASLQYYVVGKVNKPGVFTTSKTITVLQALALAGGLTPFAAENKIIIMRESGNQTSKLPFNYKKIKNGDSTEQNIPLQRGDVVLVP